MRAGRAIRCRCPSTELTKLCAEADDAVALRAPGRRRATAAVAQSRGARQDRPPRIALSLRHGHVHRHRGAQRRPLVQPLGLHQRDQRRRALRNRRRRRHVPARPAHDRPQDRVAVRSQALARPLAPRDRGFLRAPVHERGRAVARQSRQRAQGTGRGGRARRGPMRSPRGRTPRRIALEYTAADATTRSRSRAASPTPIGYARRDRDGERRIARPHDSAMPSDRLMPDAPALIVPYEASSCGRDACRRRNSARSIRCGPRSVCRSRRRRSTSIACSAGARRACSISGSAWARPLPRWRWRGPTPISSRSTCIAPGVGRLLNRIDEGGLANVRVMKHDAVEVVAAMIPPASLAGVHVFFPDPWPKKRHHKRRLLTPRVRARARAAGSRPAATFMWRPTGKNMRRRSWPRSLPKPLLENTADSFAPRPDYRPLTKFEARGLKLGHGVRDLVFRRRRDALSASAG